MKGSFLLALLVTVLRSQAAQKKTVLFLANSIEYW